MKCETCKYFKPDPYSGVFGECKRHAPSVVACQYRTTDTGWNGDAYNESYTTSVFPCVEKDDWCGDYQGTSEKATDQ